MRLTGGGPRPVGRPIRFTFDGHPVEALEGETVGAALAAAGIVALRRTPGGAPRGLHCGMGACFDCVVTVDGRQGRRACMVKASSGMQVTGALPAMPAPLHPAPRNAPSEERRPDILVVGAGPAGLSAAMAAAEAGATVAVLDERDAAGGQYLKPLFPSHATETPDAQFRLGDRMRADALRIGVRVEHRATAWAAFAAGEVAAIVDGAAVTYRPRRLILAPGAHERPVPLPGWTLPGVLTTGGLQALARAQRVCPGERVLVAGSGPLNLQLAVELVEAGARVAAVVEAAPRPGPRAWRDALTLMRAAPDLARDGARMLAVLRRARVPVLWGSRVLALLDAEPGQDGGSYGAAGTTGAGTTGAGAAGAAGNGAGTEGAPIHGEPRVRAARIATPAGDRLIAADVVALNAGFQPETGLARALGLAHRFVDSGLGHLATETDEEGRSSDPAVFAVGDGAAFGGARVAMARGRLAGLAAARDLGFASPDGVAAGPAAARAELGRALAFQNALWRLFPPPRLRPDSLADDVTVCRCEEVTAGEVRAALADGLPSVAAVKKATRAGMGRCQGRFCAATVARLCAWHAARPHGRPAAAPTPEDFAAPRAPVRPTPAAPLMLEAAEFVAPLLTLPSPPRRLHPLPDLPVEARRCDVLVIGGGILGLSTAYFLAREGADVLLAERDEAGMAASTANAGSLHVQLLSYDFDDADPDADGPAVHTLPLAPRSIALWKAIGAEAAEGLGIRTEGGLMLAEDEAGMRWLRAKQRVEARSGIESHVVGANELRSIAPALSDRMLGAVFCPAEGYGDPLRGTMALRKLAVRHGARLLRGAEVREIARDGAAWRVATSKGDVTAGRVVNAAGPWAGRIGAMVGLDLPVSGTVQQVIVTEPAAPMLQHLVALAHRHLSLKQAASGGLLVGGGWFGGFDPESGRTRTLRESIQGNLWVCDRVLPAIRGLSFARAWTGINPAIDRAPILGEAPGLPGFFNAVTANGYTLGPECGRITAEAVLGRERPDPRYTLARFGGATLSPAGTG